MRAADLLPNLDIALGALQRTLALRLLLSPRPLREEVDPVADVHHVRREVLELRLLEARDVVGGEARRETARWAVSGWGLDWGLGFGFGFGFDIGKRLFLAMDDFALPGVVLCDSLAVGETGGLVLTERERWSGL